MRFINTSTLRLEKVADFDIQDANKHPNGYAILSHRWGEEGSEIDFADVSSFDNDDQPDRARLKRIMDKAGWPKFIGACNLARTQGFHLIWIDTCCIDKRDSVELGEAINSMYRWYSEARICFVYLEDVGVMTKSFDESTWFDRGWTLQELIAPRVVWFCDNSWNLLGDKKTMLSLIEKRTGIHSEVLLHTQPPSSCSVAQRMSWAARRQTTRIEDAAYSLMGLFDVNMPMIYGEREKAFIRLQEAIIEKTGDLSIFAWEMGPTDPALGKVPGYCCGMLAPSPACFATAGDVGLLTPLQDFSTGQRGLSIKLKCRPYGLETYLADLAFSTNQHKGICILLARTRPDGQFVRIRFPEGSSITYLYSRSEGMRLTKEFRVRQERERMQLKLFPGFWLHCLKPCAKYDCKIQILSRAAVTGNDRVSIGHGYKGTAGIVKCELREEPAQGMLRYIQWMKFGFDEDSNPVCLLIYNYPGVITGSFMGVNDEMFTKAMNGRSDEHRDEGSSLFDDRWLDFDPAQKYMGFDLLKGSREIGLTACISSLTKVNIVISRRPDPSYEPSPDSHVTVGQEVWTVLVHCYEDWYKPPEPEDSKPASSSGFWKTIIRRAWNM